MGARERWAASFSNELKPWRLEAAGDVALYVTKPKVDNDPHGRLEVYHVWDGDDWVLSTQNMRAAYNKYYELVGGVASC